MRISAILLASGLSRRMGRDKLLLPFAGESLLGRAVALLAALPVDERLLVTTRARLEGLDLPPGINVILNPRPELGQSESLRLGVAAADSDGYLFLAGDQPLLTPEALAPLLDAWRQNPDRILYPIIGTAPAMPALFPARFRGELLAVRGDIGGRAVRAAHPEACAPFRPACPSLFADIDSEEEYRKATELA